MHHVRKKETGMHQDAQGVHAKASAAGRGTFEEKVDGVQGRSGKQNVPDVIVIEDDNGDSEVENYDCDIPLRRSQIHDHSSSSDHSDNESSYDTYELSGSSSDEEDCVVIEPHTSMLASFFNQKRPRAGKRPRSSADVKNESSRKRRGSPSDLSDCEIVLDFDGKVKQDWEEAALRRRTGKARRADSEESTSASVHANSDAWKSPKVHDRGDMRFQAKRTREHAFGAGPSSHAKERKDDVALDQQDSNVNVSGIGSDASAEEAVSPQNFKKCVRGDGAEASGRLDESNVFLKSSECKDGVGTPGKLGDTDLCMDPSECKEASGILTAAVKVVTDRESLKNTEEFRHADEEEWARRRMELQKQAEKVQRERKKRKLEVERKMEMEARQKRRLEEIRQSQLKEEQASGLKDQARDRVQSELDRIANTSRDMATLLRRLGVPVDGGTFATEQQVTAAYKKALLRFHPDRAAALAKSDPASQVEAEEKFKLVSKMKSVLPLVSSSFFR